MNNGSVDKHNSVFEKLHLGMESHLNPLFIKEKVDNYDVNKVLVDIGAMVNLMSVVMIVIIVMIVRIMTLNVMAYHLMIVRMRGLLGWLVALI